MSSDSTALGDRMKRYEAAARQVLPRRTYTIVRVDGRAFHTYLKHAAKPFDYDFMAMMDGTARALCREISGSVAAYAHSDEISVLVTDFASVHSEPWFGGNVQKMVSVAASIATAHFAREEAWFGWGMTGSREAILPTFDARVFTIPDPAEVVNYFVWRQRDCVRNSVSMVAQHYFTARQLQGLNSGEMQEKLWSEAGVNWNDFPAEAKRGRVCERVASEEIVTYTDKRDQSEHSVLAERHRWETGPAPAFSAESARIPLYPGAPA